MVLCLSVLADAADWNQWLGPDRSGATPEVSGWPAGWPPTRLWDKDVLEGCTSPIIVGENVYVTGWDWTDSTDKIRCLRASDGAELWSRSHPAPRYARKAGGLLSRFGGPNSTPAYDPATGHLFTLGADGDFYCWDTNNSGEPVWNRNLYNDYDPPGRPGSYNCGFCSSPLVVGGWVIVEVGGAQGTVMAFDKSNGQRVWASQCTDTQGQTSGPSAVFDVQGVQCIADLTQTRLVVMRLDAGHYGETVGGYAWETDFSCNLPTPVAIGNKVFINSSYNHDGCAFLDVNLSSGLTEVFSSRAIGSKVASPAVWNGRIYAVDEGPARCMDPASPASPVWQGGSFGHGSLLVTGDGKVVAFGNGSVSLIEATASSYTELSRVNGISPLSFSGEDCYPHLALANGYLVVKDRFGKTVAFSVGGSAGSTVSIDSFAASPTQVAPGGSSTLSWFTSNATSVALDGSVVGANGSTAVSPTQTTTYALVAQGEGGPVERQVTVSVTELPPPGDVIRINCGSNTVADWTDDNVYASGGSEFTFAGMPDTSGVSNAAPPEVYTTCRHLEPTFGVPVQSGSYTVRLHFYDEYGPRDMTVTIEGQVVIEHFDIVTEAGGTGKALVKEFGGISVVDGQIDIAFSKGSGDDAFACGIEILPDDGDPQPVLTTIQVSPSTAAMYATTQLAFEASALDQYDSPISAAFTWSASGGGTVSPGSGSSTTFTSDGTPGGFTVTAASGGVEGSASVTVQALVDTDGDGMDDTWETEQFGDLSHDATTDADGDGITDYEEFIAGTDATGSSGGGFVGGLGCSPRAPGAHRAVLGLAVWCAVVAGGAVRRRSCLRAQV